MMPAIRPSGGIAASCDARRELSEAVFATFDVRLAVCLLCGKMFRKSTNCHHVLLLFLLEARSFCPGAFRTSRGIFKYTDSARSGQTSTQTDRQTYRWSKEETEMGERANGSREPLFG